MKKVAYLSLAAAILGGICENADASRAQRAADLRRRAQCSAPALAPVQQLSEGERERIMNNFEQFADLGNDVVSKILDRENLTSQELESVREKLQSNSSVAAPSPPVVAAEVPVKQLSKDQIEQLTIARDRGEKAGLTDEEYTNLLLREANPQEIERAVRFLSTQLASAPAPVAAAASSTPKSDDIVIRKLEELYKARGKLNLRDRIQVERFWETYEQRHELQKEQIRRIGKLFEEYQNLLQNVSGEDSESEEPYSVTPDSDTSGDEALARALQEEYEAEAAVQSAPQVDDQHNRSARITPAYMDRMQEVGPNELVCPVLHSYSGQISAMPYVIRDVKEDASTAEFRRQISSKLADLNDLATVQCALTIQPNRAFRTDRDEQVHPMLFRPQWGFDKGTDVDPALGAPKNKAMLCPSVLSVYEPNKGWRAIDFRGGPAVSFHPAAGGVTAISPDSHNLGLSPEDESCAVLYHTNYPGENKTIYGVILVLSQADLELYQETLRRGGGVRTALMATSLVEDSEELQKILGLRE